ncbi:hypothetical protein ACFLTE_10130 [Bacteroidota bacterium]
MRKTNLIIIIISLVITSCNNDRERNQEFPKLEFIYSYNVNFFHFVDKLSRWSPYTKDHAFSFYNQYFEISDEDKQVLDLYRSNRILLDWEWEMELFKWAHHDYSFDSLIQLDTIEVNDLDTILYNLKKCIDYFRNKNNKQYNLSYIISERFDQLLEYKPDMDKHSDFITKKLKESQDYYNIWTSDQNVDYSEFPIYICFNFIDNYRSGGANGNGVYAEIDLSKDTSSLEGTAIILIHELLHKIIEAENIVTKTIDELDLTLSSVNNFLSQYDLTKNDLLNKLNESSPREYGDNEFSTIEEIIVYHLANVIVADKSDEFIIEKIRYYSDNDKLLHARIWTGVQLLNKLYSNFEYSENENQFIWQFIRIFYERVYFENYENIL